MKTSKSYKLLRSRRRSIGLTVTPEATLVVRAPMRTPLDYIENLIRRKAIWIKKAIARVQSRPRVAARRFSEGERFLYLGEPYELKIQEDAGKKLIFDSSLNMAFILDAKEKGNARELFTKWYKKEAKMRIGERVELYAGRFGLSYKSIKITSATRRWGSCGPRGNLNFSWKLVMVPVGVIDYVVIHELAHLEHKNHSKRFWNSVKAMYPEYEKAKMWLRVNEGMLAF